MPETLRATLLLSVLVAACGGTGSQPADGSGTEAEGEGEDGSEGASESESEAESESECAPEDCDDGIVCTEDRCAAGNCDHFPLHARCPEGTVCSPDEGCSDCPPCSDVSDCPDLGPCSIPVCDRATACCSYRNVDSDEDGHVARGCGGDDCNDDNDAVRPDGPDLCQYGSDGTTLCGPEVCDGEDNDCNGEVDEIPPDMPCDGPDVDYCSEGVIRCNRRDGTQFEPECEETTQHWETCNGLDDDCDGQVDWPELGDPCDGDDTDQCAEGTYVCYAEGTGIECSDDPSAHEEVCDGEDNDCNGVADDNISDWYWQDCDPAAQTGCPLHYACYLSLDCSDNCTRCFCPPPANPDWCDGGIICAAGYGCEMGYECHRFCSLRSPGTACPDGMECLTRAGWYSREYGLCLPPTPGFSNTCVGLSYGECVTNAMCDWSGGFAGFCHPTSSDSITDCDGIGNRDACWDTPNCTWEGGDFGECLSCDPGDVYCF